MKKGLVGIQKGLVGIQKGLVGMKKGLVGIEKGLVGIQKGLVGIEKGLVGIEKGLVGIEKGLVGMKKGASLSCLSVLWIQKSDIMAQKSKIWVFGVFWIKNRIFGAIITSFLEVNPDKEKRQK